MTVICYIGDSMDNLKREYAGWAVPMPAKRRPTKKKKKTKEMTNAGRNGRNSLASQVYSKENNNYRGGV